MVQHIFWYVLGFITPLFVFLIGGFILIRIRFHKNMKTFWDSQSKQALAMSGIQRMKEMPAHPKIITEMESCQTALQVVAVAHQLGILDLLRNNPGITSEETAEKLKLPYRPVQACFDVLFASDIICRSLAGFRLTETTFAYFQERTPFFDPLPLTYQAMKYVKSLTSGLQKGSLKHWEKGKSHQAENWAGKQHLYSFPIGFALSKLKPFEGDLRILDVAGGAGSVCIALALKNPSLRIEMLELPGSIKIARKMISKYGLAERIKLHGLDMFKKEWPKDLDIILFTNIFHDWSDEQCHILAEKTFDSLKEGGKVFIQEALLNEHKAGPLWTAHWSLTMSIITNGRQFRFSELAQILEAGGFKGINYFPLIGYFSTITGIKSFNRSYAC